MDRFSSVCWLSKHFGHMSRSHFVAKGHTLCEGQRVNLSEKLATAVKVKRALASNGVYSLTVQLHNFIIHGLTLYTFANFCSTFDPRPLSRGALARVGAEGHRVLPRAAPAELLQRQVLEPRTERLRSTSGMCTSIAEMFLLMCPHKMM